MEPRVVELLLDARELPNVSKVENLHFLVMEMLRVLDRFLVVPSVKVDGHVGLTPPQQQFFEVLLKSKMGVVERSVEEHQHFLNSLAGRLEACGMTDAQMRFMETLVDKRSGVLDSQLAKIETHVASSGQIVQNMQEELDNLTGAMKVSAKKGKLCESYIEEILKGHFPDDVTVENTALREHEADLLVTTDGGQKIVIETKFYTSQVTSSQVAKFTADLDRLNARYGIMVSLSSSIANKKRFHYEHTDDRHTIYLSNSGESVFGMVYAVLFMKELFRLEARSNAGGGAVDPLNSTDLLERKCQRILDASQEFETAFDGVTRVRFDIFKMREEVTASIDRVYKTALDAECRVKATLEQIRTSIHEQLQDMVDVQTSAPALQETIIRDLVEHRDPLAALFSKLFAITEVHDIAVRKAVDKANKYLLVREGKVVADIKRLKRRLDVCFLSLRCTVEVTEANLSCFQTLLEAECATAVSVNEPMLVADV